MLFRSATLATANVAVDAPTTRAMAGSLRSIAGSERRLMQGSPGQRTGPPASSWQRRPPTRVSRWMEPTQASIERMFGHRHSTSNAQGWTSTTELWDAANEDKLGELILYAAGQLLDDPTGGSTKVNKVLFYSEFSHIRAHGVPITGVAYQKLPEGPAPRQLIPVRERLIAEGGARLQVDQYFGKPLHRLVPLRGPRADALAQQEMDTVDQVVSALWGRTARHVSEMSHLELGWIMVEEGEDIPLSTAYLPRRAMMSDAARRRARELAASLPGAL